MVRRLVIFVLVLTVTFARGGWAQPNVRYDVIPNPYLFVLREPAVLDELRLSDQQRRAVLAANERFDGPLLAVRILPADKANQQLAQIQSSTQQEMAAILSSSQQQRLIQVALRTRGIYCLQNVGVAEQLQLTDEQRKGIAAIMEEAARDQQRVADRGQAGVPQETLDKESSAIREREYERLFAQLSALQKSRLSELLGAPFETTRLGHARFRAPELVEATGWVNSPPLRIADLRGRVVVVHFWTFACVNCLRNYPAYKNWQKAYRDRGLTMIGIHTPEGETERNVEALRTKVQEAEFDFPIVVDNDRRNWTAWGNGIWPSVYLIDKRGALRYWWYGELKWQGTDGERVMRGRIEELLAESP